MKNRKINTKEKNIKKKIIKYDPTKKKSKKKSSDNNYKQSKDFMNSIQSKRKLVSTINGNDIYFNQSKNLTVNYQTNKEAKLININNNIMTLNDYELNSLNYEDAIKFDKRTYLLYYWSLLKTKHILLFAFVPSNDYNSTIIKICLFLFSFALYYSINGLFFTDSTIHEIYKEEGNYNFIYQLPQILYSTIISTIINIIIRFFSLTQKDVLKVKKQKINEDYQIKKMRLYKYLRIKFLYFFKISLAFLILFWYYISCFCLVYKNTQIHLLKDTLISFGLSLLYPLFINLIPGFFRIYSLNKKNQNCLYVISKLIQLI